MRKIVCTFTLEQAAAELSIAQLQVGVVLRMCRGLTFTLFVGFQQVLCSHHP